MPEQATGQKSQPLEPVRVAKDVHFYLGKP
jgi:hypothetical protein